jgi:hypothetical protein
MSSSNKPLRSRRPIGFVLPALAFGMGLVAMTIGVPKELTVRRLASSGVTAPARVIAIERKGNKQNYTMAFNVGGLDYPVVAEVEKPPFHAPKQVVYMPQDPATATADLASDAKTANEYVGVGALELGVGGWILYAGIRQRRRALLNALAKSKSKST